MAAGVERATAEVFFIIVLVLGVCVDDVANSPRTPALIRWDK